MSWFFCCGDDRGPVYEVQTKDSTGKIQTKKFKNVSEIDPTTLRLADRVIRVEESEYEQLMRKHSWSSKWTDPTFPPGPKSLGSIENIPQDCQWLRISQILNNPQLFDGKVEPKDVIAGSLGSCYFLSAVAALAESENRIYNIFGNQKFTPSGIYRVKLRINGFIQEILIDDYIPVNKAEKPLFCQPNKNQFWVIILEKAWAKINGSYANILSGTPTEVFRAVTYAPSDLKLIKPDQGNRNKLWEEILFHCQHDRPCCCGAKRTEAMQESGLENRGIIPGHAYTLIKATSLEDSGKYVHRILKLRDPWENTQWSGEGNQKDQAFWNRIPECSELNALKTPNQMGDDGVFYMKYEDFCEYFNEVNVCHVMDKAAYEVQEMFADGKHGTFFSFNIKEEGDYIIELHQSRDKQEAKNQKVNQKQEKNEIKNDYDQEASRKQKLQKLAQPVENLIKQEEEEDEKINMENDFVQHDQDKERKVENKVQQRNQREQKQVEEFLREQNQENQQVPLEKQKEQEAQEKHQKSDVEEYGHKNEEQEKEKNKNYHPDYHNQKSNENIRELKESVKQIQEKKQSKKQIEEEGPNRATLILAHEKTSEFIDGVLKYNEQQLSLRSHLVPGKYVVYAKVDKDSQTNKLPSKLAISSYSKSFADIKTLQRSHFPNFFQNLFLQHARQNKKKQYDEGKLWISWKLLYEKGGYAYIAFGVEESAKKKFKIQLEEKAFNQMNFSLKKPYKNKGNISFEVLPGQEQIVVARVTNGVHKKMVFPPPLLIEIEQIKKGKKRFN